MTTLLFIILAPLLFVVLILAITAPTESAGSCALWFVSLLSQYEKDLNGENREECINRWREMCIFVSKSNPELALILMEAGREAESRGHNRDPGSEGEAPRRVGRA
jgi:hypothetical protein